MKIQIQASVTLSKEELQQAVAEYVARNSNIDVTDADITVTKDGAVVVVNTDQVPEVTKEVVEPTVQVQPKVAKTTTQAAKSSQRESAKLSAATIEADKAQVAEVLAAGQKLLDQGNTTQGAKPNALSAASAVMEETDSIEPDEVHVDEAVGQSILDNPSEIKRGNTDIFGTATPTKTPLVQAAVPKPNNDSIFG